MTILTDWFFTGILDIYFLHGTVSGHPCLPYGIPVSTSPVESVEFSADGAELLVQTKNTLYHCPLQSCDDELCSEFLSSAVFSEDTPMGLIIWALDRSHGA